MIRILTLNVRGLKSTISPTLDRHRQKNEKFWKIINTESPELLCLTETKTAETSIDIPGYELVASRLARRAGGTNGTGSPSGGLAIYRNSQKKTINLGSLSETLRLCQCPDVCETCRYFLVVEMKLNNVCFYMCLVYIPPKRSGTAPENPFEVIQNVLNEVGQDNLALITGDFNARNREWNDNVTNPYGRLLKNLCDYNGLVKLNGTSDDSDSGGQFTCVGRNGNSVVDHAFMKRGTSQFQYDFRVMTNEPSADHRAILVTLKDVVESNFISGGFVAPARRTPPNYHIQDYEDDVEDNYGDPAFDDDE